MIDRRSPHPRRQVSDRRTADRRENPRYPSEADVRFLRAGASAETVLHGRLLDASPSGVRILLEEPPGPSETLLIEVRDPSGPCFNLTARVVWSESVEEDRYRVGCELAVTMTARQCALLNRIAAAQESAARAS